MLRQRCVGSKDGILATIEVLASGYLGGDSPSKGDREAVVVYALYGIFVSN